MNEQHPNQAIRNTSKQLEQFFRDVEIEFLIHELKDPISVIETGLLTLLGKQAKFGALSPKQEKTLKRALRNTKKARSMLSNLLEIGRSEAGCFDSCRFLPAESAYQALEDALEIHAWDTFEELKTYTKKNDAINFLADHGIVIEISPEAARIEMSQDEIKFRQIVGNLLKNALHHCRRRIEMKMELEDNHLNMAITDDGPGIDPEHHEMIFKRYAQVKECSIVPRKGHGLGLAGSLILARCLGGDIKLESKAGQGATFRLTLPLKLKGEE